MNQKMTLKDTINGMLSKDYKVRLQAERDQCAIRLRDLESYMGKISPHGKTFDLLWVQRQKMMDYLQVLDQRLEL